MTYEEAVDLFYEDEEIQNKFDYWEIDHAIATIRTFIDDVEKIVEEREKEEQ